MLGIEAIAWNPCVEDTLCNLHLWCCILSRKHKRPHAYLSLDHPIILELEEQDRHHPNQEKKGAHDAIERDTRGFQGKELQSLPKVTKGHQRCQKDTQR